MSVVNDLFRRYELLACEADQAFEKMRARYGASMKCRAGCSDCCHAVFGLFPIEAAYLQECFSRLGRKERRAALIRAEKSARDLERVMSGHNVEKGDPVSPHRALATQRVRCPLLDDQQACIAYPFRPVTCRIYGIPALIRGQIHACPKNLFRPGQSYPAFDLDEAHREMYHMSVDLLSGRHGSPPDGAAFLVSVAKTITTPRGDLVKDLLIIRRKEDGT
jgi:Fe-S-cluster containining protein